MKMFSYYGNVSFWLNKITRVEKVSREHWLESRRIARKLSPGSLIIIRETGNRPEKIKALVEFSYKK